MGEAITIFLHSHLELERLSDFCLNAMTGPGADESWVLESINLLVNMAPSYNDKSKKTSISKHEFDIFLLYFGILKKQTHVVFWSKNTNKNPSLETSAPGSCEFTASIKTGFFDGVLIKDSTYWKYEMYNIQPSAKGWLEWRECWLLLKTTWCLISNMWFLSCWPTHFEGDILILWIP